MKVTFYYVRHGKTLFNEIGRMQGMCDSPLTEEGIDNAVDTGSALRHVPFASAYSSSSERAWKTAEQICQYHHIQPVLMKDLREFDFGDLDGEEVQKFKDKIWGSGMRDDWTKYHGESQEIFDTRTRRAFNHIIANAKDGDNVLLVSHGSFIMHLMKTLLNFDQQAYVDRCNQIGRPWMPNGGIVIFTYEDGNWQIIQEPMSADEYRKKYDPKTIHFTFVRHGQTHFNTQKRLQGQCDSPLTAAGIQQAQQLSETFKDQRFDHVYTSSAERARDTADIIIKDRDVPVSIETDLKEVYFGTLEGCHYEKRWEQNWKMHLDVDYSSVGGETKQQVFRRIRSILRKIYDNSHDGDSILIVSHGDIYMSMMEMLFGTKREDLYAEAQKKNTNPMPNCGIFRFVCSNMEYTLVKRMDE